MTTFSVLTRLALKGSSMSCDDGTVHALTNNFSTITCYHCSDPRLFTHTIGESRISRMVHHVWFDEAHCDRFAPCVCHRLLDEFARFHEDQYVKYYASDSEQEVPGEVEEHERQINGAGVVGNVTEPIRARHG